MATSKARSRAPRSPTFKPYMKHVMIDAETLGTKADSVILSLGAVKFDLDSDEMDPEGFYASISIDSCLDHGRKIDESTLIWWLSQSREAQAVFHEPKQSLDAALSSFTDWLGHNKRCIWSNGADFDIPMLNHAYARLGWEQPWEFWNSRCVRTYKALPGAKEVCDRIKREGTHHNALADAVHQVRLVQAVQAKLRGKVAT